MSFYEDICGKTFEEIRDNMRWQTYFKEICNLQTGLLSLAFEDPDISELDFYKLIHSIIEDLLEWNCHGKHLEETGD